MKGRFRPPNQNNINLKSLCPNLFSLRICIWNFNGLKCSKVQHIKDSKNDLLANILNYNDLICFSETWRDSADSFSLGWDDDFVEFHECGARSFRGGRASGGMSLLTRKSIARSCSVVSADSFHLWCKLDKNFFGWDSDLFVCFLYIPPNTSNWFQSGRSFTYDALQVECACFEKLGWILLCGDMNARISDALDYIENDEIDAFLPIDDHYEPDTPLSLRKSADKDFINTSGQLLIEFCKSTGYRILNGRINKENSCAFTCFTSRGNSVVDYALTKSTYFDHIEDFRIRELSELSDHCPLEIKIKTSSSPNKNEDLPILSSNLILSNIDNLKNDYKMQFSLNTNSGELMKIANESETILKFLNDVEEELDDASFSVEKTVNSLRQQLIEIAKQNLHPRPIFVNHNEKSKQSGAWFDLECKSGKQRLNNVRKTYENIVKLSISRDNPRVEAARDFYFSERRRYKKLLKHKRKSYLNVEKDKLWALKTNSPKEFWKKLSSGKKSNNIDFTYTELFNHFNELLNNNTSRPNDNESANPVNSDVRPLSLDDFALSAIDDSLNCPITFTEVEQMIKRLKSGKASGLDMLNAELLKNLNKRFISVFVKLFNKILNSGDFPEESCRHHCSSV